MCRAPKPSPVICVYCGSIDHCSGNCPNKPWDNREQPHSTPDVLRNHQQQQANSEILGDAPGNAQTTGNTTGNTNPPAPPHPQATSQGTNTKISGNSAPTNSSNRNTQSKFSSMLSQGYQNQHHDFPNRITGTSGTGWQQPSNQQRYNNNAQFPYRDYRYEQQQRAAQPQAWFDKSHNQRYSPPAYLPTPSINSSFSGNDTLSRSLIQIIQNQTRPIDALLASQQSQIDTYREMTRSNKMREDDGLLNLFLCMTVQTHPCSNTGWMTLIKQLV